MSGNDASLHIFKITVNLTDDSIVLTDAIKYFFPKGKCEFMSDVMHIHVDKIAKNALMVSVATEFGEIKIFEVSRDEDGP